MSISASNTKAQHAERVDDDVDDAARPGRPRDDAREQAILDAALELIAEVGVDRMSMDALAARAKASKATIYRRWPGKTELVVEAIHRRVAPASSPAIDTGSLRGDLLGVVRAMCAQLCGDDGGLLCGMAVAVRNDTSLGRALHDQLYDAKMRMAAPILDRARARGEVPDNVDPALFFEVAPGIALHRQMSGLPLDDDFAAHLVDDILIPMFRNRPPSA